MAFPLFTLTVTLGLGLSFIDPCSAIICYKCNSLDTPDCAMSLDASDLPYEDCKTELRCIMSVVDSVTYRGCGLTPTIGAKYSKDCFTNLCNRGVFPPGRLKCYHCSGAGTDCIEKPQGKPRPCLTHHEEDQCFTEIVDASRVNRGCRSDANHTETDATIVYCDINGCNNEPAVSKLACAKCDSKVDRGCKMDLSAASQTSCNISQYDVCEVDVLLSQNETCFHYHHLDRVVRGCKRDIPEDIKDDIAHLTECNDDDLCNRKCLEQQRCLICDSTKNGDCRSNTTSLAKQTCGSAETSSCYALEFDNWEVSRDCGPLPDDLTHVNRYYECDQGDGCNETLLTRCYKCSSGQTANCANWERPGPDIGIEECEEAGAHCIKAAFNNGSIVRGCQSVALNCDDSLTSCESCHGSFCNTGAFPAQRLRCYQCSGEDECRGIDSDPLPCPESILGPTDAREACFEFYDAEAKGMVRGCRSNAAAYYKCIFQAAAGLDCHVCYQDGCNNSPSTTTPLLSCFKCQGGLDCQMEQGNALFLKACSQPVPFGYNESCFITRHIDGSTSRGCSLDVQWDAYSKSNWDQTHYCYTSGCNSPATAEKSNK